MVFDDSLPYIMKQLHLEHIGVYYEPTPLRASSVLLSWSLPVVKFSLNPYKNITISPYVS